MRPIGTLLLVDGSSIFHVHGGGEESYARLLRSPSPTPHSRITDIGVQMGGTRRRMIPKTY